MPIRKKQSGPHQHRRLTAKFIERKNLQPGVYFDGDGLILRVTKNSSKSWILRTLIQQKRCDMGLGGFPGVSLAEAREAAVRYRAIARNGGNPIEERKKERVRAPSFREAAELVHKHHGPSWKNSKHASQWISTLKAYVFPELGDFRVDHIRSEHIVRVLSPIWLSKDETARRVLQRIGTVLLWAKGNGYRADSPTDEMRAARKALPKQSKAQRHHKALPYTDVPRFITKLRDCGASASVKLALEFLILTAARSGEVRGAKWSEIDIDAHVWTIPAARMKASREHQVPLSDRCMEILAAARKLDGAAKEYVFPGMVSGKPLSDMALLMAIRRMGFDVTAHGFRSTFRVWCAEQTRYPGDVAEAALAHTIRNATEAAYMRSTFFEKRRAMMAEWSYHATRPTHEIVQTSDELSASVPVVPHELLRRSQRASLT